MASIWFESPAPALDADDPQAVTNRTWDLVVVGGGIVGMLSALRARQHGRDVCVVDAGRVGEGTTARATVKVTAGHGALLAEIASRHGPESAVAYQRANDAGFARLSSLVADLPEDVGWTVSPHIVHASHHTSLDRLRMAGELASRAGSLVTQCQPPTWATGEAWCWENSALVQPVSLARALGRLLQGAGVPVVEHARVVGFRSGEGYQQLRLEDGDELRAQDTLVATHAPVHDPDGHVLRAEVVRHAALAVPCRADDVPSSYEVGGISTRPVTLPDGRPGAVVVGQPRRAGSMSPDAWDSLHDWATRALSAGAPTFRWGAQDLRSLDLLPYVGRTRRSPHVLVATGLNGWGFTNAAALADQIPLILDREGAYRPDEVNVPRWQADRVFPSGGWTDAAATTWWMGRSVVGDLVRSMLHGGDDLGPGQGRVRGGPLDPLAECITTDGERHCVSARCTHMGCLVRWNGTEQSWDCPCHGSRFDPEGRVLEGPARTPLERP